MDKGIVEWRAAFWAYHFVRVAGHSPIFSPLWGVAGFAFRPSAGDCRRMVVDLVSRFGRHGASALLVVPGLNVGGWNDGRWAPDAGTRRATWLVWRKTAWKGGFAILALPPSRN